MEATAPVITGGESVDLVRGDPMTPQRITVRGHVNAPEVSVGISGQPDGVLLRRGSLCGDDNGAVVFCDGDAGGFADGDGVIHSNDNGDGVLGRIVDEGDYVDGE